MSYYFSHPQYQLPAVIFSTLLFASVVCVLMKLLPINSQKPKLVDEIIRRTWAWWIIAIVVVGAVLTGIYSTLFLFFLVSFWALREYLTLIDTNRADHRALFWSFVLITPMQYLLIASDWYGMYSIFIPVYAFIFVPIVMVIRGDTDRFLLRTATIQWGLMIGVYFVSHVPALLTLDIPGYEDRGGNVILFLLMITGLSDVFQFVAGKTLGRNPIAPSVSPNKTWEGFIGGLVATVVVGCLLASATPFGTFQAGVMTAAVVVFGFFGGLIMSAIKREHGVKDYGTLLPGHGGILDRIDSLIFSAPLFFHFTRYFYTL